MTLGVEDPGLVNVLSDAFNAGLEGEYELVVPGHPSHGTKRQPIDNVRSPDGGGLVSVRWTINRMSLLGGFLPYHCRDLCDPHQWLEMQLSSLDLRPCAKLPQ